MGKSPVAGFREVHKNVSFNTAKAQAKEGNNHSEKWIQKQKAALEKSNYKFDRKSEETQLLQVMESVARKQAIAAGMKTEAEVKNFYENKADWGQILKAAASILLSINMGLWNTGCNSANQTKQRGEIVSASVAQVDMNDAFKADEETLTEMRQDLGALKVDLDDFNNALPQPENDRVEAVEITEKNHTDLYDASTKTLRSQLAALNTKIMQVKGTPFEIEKLTEAHKKLTEAYYQFTTKTKMEQIKADKEIAEKADDSELKKVTLAQLEREVGDVKRSSDYTVVTYDNYGKDNSILTRAIKNLKNEIDLIDAKYDILIETKKLTQEIEELSNKLKNPDTSRSVITDQDISSRIALILGITSNFPGVYREIKALDNETTASFESWYNKVNLAARAGDSKTLDTLLAEAPNTSAMLSDRLKAKIEAEKRK